MKKIVFTISLTQILLGIVVCIFAFHANSTGKDIKNFEAETQKSLNETAQAVNGVHDIYSGSAKCTVEAAKNMQKTVPAIKRLGWNINGLSHVPMIGKKLGHEPGTPVVEFAVNFDDFLKNITTYYNTHNEQNKKTIKTAAETLHSTSRKIGKNPFSNTFSMIQKLLFLLGLVFFINGCVILCCGRD